MGHSGKLAWMSRTCERRGRAVESAKRDDKKLLDNEVDQQGSSVMVLVTG